MTRHEAYYLKAKIKDILAGIDGTEDTAESWWETSTGEEFGAKKLAEVLKAIDGEVME